MSAFFSWCAGILAKSTTFVKINTSDMQRCALIILLAFAAASCGGGEKHAGTEAQIPQAGRTDTTQLLADRIARCSRLVTTEYSLHKIVTFDDKIIVSGSLLSHSFKQELPVGDRKIAIPIDVTLRGYIDFSDFDVTNIKRRGNRITITLPDPTIVVSSSKIDHKGIRKAVGTLRSDFKASEIDNYTRQGVDSIERHIPELGIIESARVSAVNALVPIIKEMGYEEQDITINFRPAVNDRSILRWTDVERLIKK